MRFLYRAIFVLLCVVALLSYFYYFNTADVGTELLEPIDDHYGEECLYNGKSYKEGELFELPCKQCYCSFGKIECAVMHCIETGNTLGKDLIKRSIQVMITTEDEEMVGMVALMNSILKHTAKPVHFTLIVPLNSVTHLQKWLEGTTLRTAQYNIKGHEDKWWDDLSLTEEEKKKVLKEDKDKLAKLTAFSRLRLGSILPMEHKVIVMDSDMVVQGDISELFELDLGNHTVGMSSDCHTRTKTTSIFPPYFSTMFDTSNEKMQNITTSCSPIHTPYLAHSHSALEIKHLKLDPTSCTFSPSLMVVDLDKWFREGHEKALLSLMAFLFRNKEVYKLTVSRVMYTLPLLLQFHNNFLDLDPAWNVRNLGYTRNPHYSGAYIEKAKLLHWNGRLKPWATWSQLQQIWDQYYLEDPTGLFRLERSEKQEYEADKGASNPAGLDAPGEVIKS